MLVPADIDVCTGLVLIYTDARLNWCGYIAAAETGGDMLNNHLCINDFITHKVFFIEPVYMYMQFKMFDIFFVCEKW